MSSPGDTVSIQGSPAPARPRPKRWPMVTLVVAIVVLVAVLVANAISLPYWVFLPGQAQAVGPLLSVPRAHGKPIGNQLLLTDVDVSDVSALTWITYHFNSGASLMRKSDYIPSGVSEAEYDQQSLVDMDESQLTAAAVSLRQVGYAVPEYDDGVLVYGLLPGTDADSVLSVGDIITSVDGKPTPNVTVLGQVEASSSWRPGQIAILTVRKLGSPGRDGPVHTVRVRLTSTTVKHKTYTIIGINYFYTQPGYRLPFPVSVSVNNIGGPSAGLAFTLGLIDSLSGGRLFGHHVVCATGTIDPTGQVGAVGGIPQKTVAAENAGATVFLVPAAGGGPGQPTNASQARAVANSSIRVYAVGTLAQALHDLASLGGGLGTAAKGPPSGRGGHSVPEEWPYYPWS